MNRKLQVFAGLVLAALLTSAGAHQTLADGGKARVESPDRTLIVSWTVGTGKLTFFDVEKAKVAGTLDILFPADESRFTLSGRYICINESGQNGHLVFVDALTRRIVLKLQGTTSRFLGCGGHAGFPDPSLPLDARGSNLIQVEQIDLSGPPSCGSNWQVQVVNEQFWDPRLRKPKIVYQNSWTGTAC